MPEILALQEMSGVQDDLGVQKASEWSVTYCDEKSTLSAFLC